VNVKSPLKLVLCSTLLLSGPCILAQAGDVTATFTIAPHTSKAAKHPTLNNIVLWLTPIDDSTPLRAVLPPTTGYRLTQKNKEFSPHLLVVPAGTSVDFPNLDPFFHNVFSLFNGKRFDLGLYEAGQHRAVRFDREGVSYIFCNIHPEMGAIVVALKTPFYAVSSANGAVTIPNVPPGQYRLHMWAEQYQGTNSGDSVDSGRRIIQVTKEGASLGTIVLTPAPDPLSNHKNKFGEDYPATPSATY
jgi:hypothetical protein